MKKILTLFVSLMVVCISVFAQEKELKLNPAYSDIKVDKDNKTIEKLLSKDKKVVDKTVKEVLKNLDSYNPSVLYVLSNVYFQENKDEASRIFYIGQLRARIDANICQDISAREAVSLLNEQFGYLINTYTFQNVENLERIVNDAIEYVKKNDIKYDRRWINLHGMKSYVFEEGGKSYTEPKEQWQKIIDSTIDSYSKGFLGALESIKNKN